MRVPEGRQPLRMVASRGPVATFGWARSPPRASRMVRASLMTPAGVIQFTPSHCQRPQTVRADPRVMRAVASPAMA
nr:MAG TPA: hypothetical protein [Caudoviricetes sp.]